MNRLCADSVNEFMISHSNMSDSSNKDDKCITSIYFSNWCVKIFFWTSWVSGKKYLPSLSSSNIVILKYPRLNRGIRESEVIIIPFNIQDVGFCRREKGISFLTVCGAFIVVHILVFFSSLSSPFQGKGLSTANYIDMLVKCLLYWVQKMDKLYVSEK